MQRYRKRPEIVECLQLRHSTWDAMIDFVGHRAASPANFLYHILPEEASDICGEEGPEYLCFIVTNANGEAETVRHGDWVIPDSIPGTFHRMTPNEFAAKYEPIEE